MKKKLMRSFLQKNEINVCMVELLKKYGAYIRAKAIRAVSNEAEREELTAGIIIHLYEKLSKMVYTEEGKFEYWLHTVVNHYIISWRRKRAKKLPISDIELERIPSASPSLGETLHRERLYEILWKAVDALEDSQREILLLFKFRKYSNNVIKKAKEFDNSMIITILMSPNKRYSTL